MGEPVLTGWVDCWNCGGSGELEGSCCCMDDSCCCLEPEPATCSHCAGEGGYHVPAGAAQMEEADDGR